MNDRVSAMKNLPSKEISEETFRFLMEERFRKWEQSCHCCGACCGAVEGDPCLHLARNPDGKYFCDIYEKRLGTRKTMSGKTFKCVMIRDILDKSWPGDSRCAYKKSKTE